MNQEDEGPKRGLAPFEDGRNLGVKIVREAGKVSPPAE